MTLDPEFSKQTTDLIQQTLELYKSAGHLQELAKHGNVVTLETFCVDFL
jgi:hypothetical protein